ncbi:hypothetical protein [Flavobacterium soli]|uniref:hypothetical protein n=1 Tax=Flavobacterium soli TaxID=344881 RepID=UPI0004005EC3|nr:hypothetical protein [Flavobacterium soli]
MSERWKYQLKTGGFWGIFMTVFMALFEMKEHPLVEQLVSGQFYFRMVTFLIVGIFLLGYINWRAKVKRSEK